MVQADRARCELDTETDMSYRFVSDDINRTTCDPVQGFALAHPSDAADTGDLLRG